MYKAIKGTYENGNVILEEPAPTMQKTKVLLIFLTDENEEEKPIERGVRKIGSLAGMGYSIPDDFNDPLDDLKEYM